MYCYLQDFIEKENKAGYLRFCSRGAIYMYHNKIVYNSVRLLYTLISFIIEISVDRGKF